MKLGLSTPPVWEKRGKKISCNAPHTAVNIQHILKNIEGLRNFVSVILTNKDGQKIYLKYFPGMWPWASYLAVANFFFFIKTL